MRLDTDTLQLRGVAPDTWSWESVRLVALDEDEARGSDATTQAEAVPAAPVLTETAVFNAGSHTFTLTLNWTLPDAGTAPILGYVVYSRSGNGVTVPTVAQLTTTTRTSSGVFDTTFGVTAYNAWGASALSNLAYIATPTHVVPSLTARWVVDAHPTLGIRIGWGEVPAQGGEPVATQYIIYRQHPLTGDWDQAYLASPGTTHYVDYSDYAQSAALGLNYRATSVGWWGESTPSGSVNPGPQVLPPPGPDNPYDGT